MSENKFKTLAREFMDYYRNTKLLLKFLYLSPNCFKCLHSISFKLVETKYIWDITKMSNNIGKYNHGSKMKVNIHGITDLTDNLSPPREQGSKQR